MRFDCFAMHRYNLPFEVAVKVQRPDVREQVTLDLFVVRQIASIGATSLISRATHGD